MAHLSQGRRLSFRVKKNGDGRAIGGLKIAIQEMIPQFCLRILVRVELV